MTRHGINATEYVKNIKCERCGISNNECKIKHNERLHLHHTNNDGRKNMRLKMKPVNNIDEYMILRRSCHASLDNKNRDYTGRGYKTWETRRKNILIKMGIVSN